MCPIKIYFYLLKIDRITFYPHHNQFDFIPRIFTSLRGELIAKILCPYTALF